MYLTNIDKMNFTAIDESASYAFKNLINFLSDNDYNADYYIRNFKRMKREFDKYYQITPEVEKILKKIINDRVIKDKEISKYYEPVNMALFDKYFHYRIILKKNPKFESFTRIPGLYLYAYLYKTVFQDKVYSLNYGSMSIPYIVDNKYCVFISFDEDEITGIDIVICSNSVSGDDITLLFVYDWNKFICTEDFLK